MATIMRTQTPFLTTVFCIVFSIAKAQSNDDIFENIDPFVNWSEKNEDYNDIDGHLATRGIVKDENYRWNYGIVPYVYDPALKNPETSIGEIKRVMATYERLTCIRFMPWTKENGQTTNDKLGLPHQAYLRFYSADGCHAVLGRRIPAQGISCCKGLNCVHEIGHSLGMIHEQQSYDPDRYWSLGTNFQNVKSGNHAAFGTYVLEDISVGGYDFSSPMQYKLWGLSNGKGATTTVFFPDMQIVKDNLHYMFREISLAHKCAEMNCSHVDLTCVNDGYMTLVDGKCKCQCVHGLDPDTGCTTVINSRTSTQAWPGGSYALPEHKGGCADESAQSGTTTHFTQGIPHADRIHNWEGKISGNKISQSFCVTEGSSSSDVWPAGTYCIYRKGGECPADFKESSVLFYNSPEAETPNTRSRVLPDREFGENTRIYYCCKDNAMNTATLYLPTQKSFSLLRFKSNKCPIVRGMFIKEESYTITNSQNGNDTIDTRIEGSPPLNVRGNAFTTIFCLYTPSNLECGGVIELSKDNPSYQFSSTENSDQECHWFIKAPEGQQLRLQFENFNVNCKDYLGVKYFKPGQPAVKFCGDRLDRTIQSVYSWIVVSFTARGETQSHFTATATLTLDEDMCYLAEDRGMTYNGNVNFTRFFEPCVAWSEVGHCEHGLANYLDKGGNMTLDGNFCRNPDFATGIQPWCYTSKHCDRNYCDPCLLGQVYDTRTDCAIQDQSKGICSLKEFKENAFYGCAKTCNFMHEKPPKATEVTCDKPPNAIDGFPLECRQAQYSVGSSVTYKCNDNDITRKRFCLTSGQWSPMGYVCTVNAKCVDFFPECSDMFRSDPTICSKQGIALKSCPYTCGTCGESEESSCQIEPPSANVTTLTSKTVLKTGETIEYRCKDGFFEVSGDKLRGCVEGGLTGNPLICDLPDGFPSEAGWRWLQTTKSWYKLFDDVALSSKNASKMCERMGCFLPRPKTEEENEIVLETSSGKNVWIGLSDSKEEGKFVWQDGEDLIGWTNWETPNPDDIGQGWYGADCTEMTWNGRWWDRLCWKQLKYYVCECKPGSLMEKTQSVFVNPKVPFKAFLSKTGFPTRSIIIEGKTKRNTFYINLLGDFLSDKKLILFHISIRLPSRKVVLNSKIDRWESGVWKNGPAFKVDSPFKLNVTIEDDHYSISVDDKFFAEFEYRHPEFNTEILEVVGAVTLTKVFFE